MPRITSQKTRRVLLTTGVTLDPATVPEKLEIYDVTGVPLSIPRGGRRTISKGTASLAAAVDTGKLSTRAAGGAESGEWDIGAKAALLTYISVDKPCRVRLYVTPAQRDADAARSRFVDPMDLNGPGTVPDHGCLAEFLLLTQLSMTNIPADLLQVAAGAGDTKIYYRIGNFDLTPGGITVTLTLKDVEQ